MRMLEWKKLLRSARVSDMTNERRIECKENHKHLREVYSWFKGNGNPGAGKRLLALEDLANGKGETASMMKIKEHIESHTRASDRRWDLYVGFALIIASVVLTRVL